MAMVHKALWFTCSSENIRFQQGVSLGRLEFGIVYDSTFIDQYMLHTVRSFHMSILLQHMDFHMI